MSRSKKNQLAMQPFPNPAFLNLTIGTLPMELNVKLKPRSTMKKLSLLSVLCILLCQISFAQKTEMRDAGSFSEVSISGGYYVIMKQGNSTSVKLEGDEDDLEKIEVINESGKLIIRSKRHKKGRGWNDYKIGRVNIEIVYSQLKELISSGSSKIKVESTIKTNRLKYTGSGSGEIDMKIDVENLSVYLTGSGDLNVDGKAKESSYTITGSGDIYASNMKTNTADAKITGSGSMKINVSERIEGRITGSGSIRYKGDPRQSVKITGSGSVKSMN
ncbi:MAG: hypothetical protein ACJAWV_001733 [Flammeovirgaceae bacterium]|jgi:hypothetical protein